MLVEPKAGAPSSDSGTFASGVAFVDGEFVPAPQARIPLLDWGFLRSDACQDTVSVWNGLFFCLERHLERFRRSCHELRLTCPYEEHEIAAILARMVRLSGRPDAYAQMIATRGVSEPGSRDPRTCRNQFLAFCLPYVRIAPKGGPGMLDLVTSDRVRIPASSVPSTIKNYHWIDFELGLLDAYERGANSVVLSDGAGGVTEGPGFNLFCVRDGELITPDGNVLEGITRGVVIELATELSIPVSVRHLPKPVLAAADEAFATSTAGGIMPIRSIDGREMTASPGTVTQRIRDLYWQRREAGWHGTPIEDL